MFRLSAFALAIPLALSACTTSPPGTLAPRTGAIDSAVAPLGTVSAADPRAEDAGFAILAQGGSASDAAIAVMLALTVVEPQSSGIGGGGFMLHGTQQGAVTSFDGRETAPSAASPDWFLGADGEPLPFREAVLSGLSVGVPGNIALAAKAHARFGRLEWAELFAPAIALARDGWVVNRRLESSLRDSATRGSADPAGRALFYDAAGEPVATGTRVTNPALATTLERIARLGPQAFYEGELPMALAAKVSAATPRSGGMTAEDIEGYAAKEREPICGYYRSYRICGMGPPSSGGIAVLAMLEQLEQFDLGMLGPDSPTAWHLFLESQRLAYADRELYLADPDFVPVPTAGLIDPAYLEARGRLIDRDTALEEALPGVPPSAPLAQADGDEPVENGTSHFVVADADGNVVSYTSTVEGAFGSGLLFGGFYLNNELTDFSFSPDIDGVPVANRVEGGKRPRSSMAPTLVYDPQGAPFLLIGAAGGSTIPVQVARSIIGVIDFGLPLDEALGLPLIMAYGDSVIVEDNTVLLAMIPALQALGHETIAARTPPLKANAALRTAQGWRSARDPRLEAMLSTEPAAPVEGATAD
ncbi:gamma-glutamyltransferase [Altererythrobacter sp. SALINAS58]|uniref:gamma-glutamyltransferase n=1 Tax=Alteripontixanthobacter muriae TaxID=2705546 RepID=UPI0015763DEA|nr:gamma-glutamyltransferase [Alteripontixanthobacter muriae]NTZ43567.1 gamma-glutamyltransferase [Alteripontixanthobacter muriae]